MDNFTMKGNFKTSLPYTLCAFTETSTSEKIFHFAHLFLILTQLHIKKLMVLPQLT